MESILLTEPYVSPSALQSLDQSLTAQQDDSESGFKRPELPEWLRKVRNPSWAVTLNMDVTRDGAPSRGLPSNKELGLRTQQGFHGSDASCRSAGIATFPAEASSEWPAVVTWIGEVNVSLRPNSERLVGLQCPDGEDVQPFTLSRAYDSDAPLINVDAMPGVEALLARWYKTANSRMAIMKPYKTGRVEFFVSMQEREEVGMKARPASSR